MIELKVGDFFTIDGERYMLGTDGNFKPIITKHPYPTVTAFGWTPGQWFIAANVMPTSPDSLRNNDAFIDLQRDYLRKFGKEPYCAGYPLINNITSMFLSNSGIEPTGDRNYPRKCQF